MKSRFFSFLLFVFFFFASSAFAQIPASIGGLDLSVSTNSPAPGQKVTITARSYTIDINSAKVVWMINNTTIKSGTGATVLEVTAPVLGKTLSIKVSATTPEGRSEVGTTLIGSGSVDIIFETDGYVAPLFKGKITPVYQNKVKIIAIPHMANSNGAEYDPKTLVYQWKKNSRAIEDQSGYGKQSITLVGDIVPRPYDISVDVWPRDNTAHAQGMISVAVGGPSISFYIDDPLYGPLFNQALRSIIRIGSQKETTVLAIPFGFNKSSSGIGNLSWSWSVNYAAHNELSSNQSVVLRAPDNSTGSSDIQLNIVNPDKILQGASGRFSAVFSAQKASTADQITF